jgi:hypothetical protein
VAVIDRDLGYNAVVAELRRLNGHEVNAGILRDAGNAKNGVPLTDVAFYNEYGTKKIPSRPFVRIASDENAGAWAKEAANGVGGIIDRSIKWQKCCEMVGKKMVPDIQKIFGDKSKLAPNAPATVRRKGHDLPLIDTGLMRSRVNYRVD